MEKQIARELLSIGAVFLRPDEPFTWASGIQSPIYCDNRLTLTAPEVRTHVEEGLKALIEKNYPDVEVEVVAGVTAALSGGAVLGSPMTHDLAIISLSDLLTPMEKIVKRLRCAAEGDFVMAIYNPSSKKRADYLRNACDIVLEYRPSDTVCGYVRNIGRDGQESRVLTLDELRNTQVDMFTTVFIGSKG